MPINALATISVQPDSCSNDLVRQRLIRLAELIRKDGAPYPLTAQLVGVWVDVFQHSQLTPEQIGAAFRRAETACRFFPSPAEVLGFVSAAQASAIEEEAGQKWTRVLEYAVRRSPDIPEHNPPRISDKTRSAIRAAGDLDYIRDCDRESLQWARKRFVEAYVRYVQLEHDGHLLPDGEIKSLLETVAAQKSLPASGKPKEAAAAR
jgi:hypothetical protein